jgi:hypothetical protein
MENLKIRHAATVSTLNLEIDHLQISLATDRRQTKKLKAALDDLSKDIARETYGRRREVSLRLALLLREATIAEGLQKWSRNARELLTHSFQGKGDTQASLRTCVEGAEALLQTLNGDNSLEMDANGSVARIMAAQNAVVTFVEELYVETGKRMELERQRGHAFFSDTPAPTTLTAPANTSAPRGNSASSATQPVPFADAPTLSRLTETTSLHSSSGNAPSLAKQASVSTALPSQPSPAAVVVPAAATYTHILPPKLPNEHIVINGRKPEPGQGSDNLAILDQVKPATRESKYVENSTTKLFVGSADTVYQPARLSWQEVNFDHAELQPVIESPSNPFPASTSSISFAASNQSKYSNIIANGVGLPISLETSTPPPSTPHPLISDLNKVRHRYNDLQRAFRDCHLTLKDLKNSISSISPVTETLAILQTAIQRLDDFNEDARVELEILIADEELSTRGYQTLLNVPGAISNDNDQVEVENRIRAFVDGTEKTITKTTEQLQRKLDDLRHDIASVKKALHDLPDLELQQFSTSQTTGWSSWTNILGPPRAASPAPPTFGTIMTSPRLRQSSSFTQSHDSRSSSVESSPARSDPFAGLGLRIPMPSHTTSYLGVSHSPLASRPGPRPRTISTMYTLGLGSKSTSLAVNSQVANSTLSRSAISTHWSDQPQEETMPDETETEAEDELQTDVE